VSSHARARAMTFPKVLVRGLATTGQTMSVTKCGNRRVPRETTAYARNASAGKGLGRRPLRRSQEAVAEGGIGLDEVLDSRPEVPGRPSSSRMRRHTTLSGYKASPSTTSGRPSR